MSSNNKNKSHEEYQHGKASNHPHSSIVLMSAAAVLLLGNCLIDNVNGFPLQFSSGSRLHQSGRQTDHYRYETYQRIDTQLFYNSPKNKGKGYNYLVNQWVEARDAGVVSLYATNDRNKQTTWSKSLSDVDTNENNNDGSSRFGVRRRVRSVLRKARDRTGIRNSSFDDDDDEDYPQIRTKMTAPNVVAEAASIGGLGAVVVDEDSGTIGVALDFVGDFYDEKEDTTVKKDKYSASTDNDRKNTISQSDSAKSIPVNGFVGGTNVTQATAKKVTNSKKKKTNPASTYSRSYTMPSNPEDSLVVPTDKNSSSKKVSSSEMDALRGDLSGAFSLPPPPLPFTLPTLTKDQMAQIRDGERIQFQTDMGREGSGFVVLDVNAPADTVWECLLDFSAYPSTIPTVRAVEMFTSTHLSEDYTSETPIINGKKITKLKYGVPSITRAAFTLSKFRLKIAALHKYRPHPRGDYMIFTLDPACTNIVLRNAKGVWHTQSNPDGKGEDWTRVWLLCELKVSSLLPQWITDYAARRAMPRATSWIKPTVEAAASLWLRKQK